jgi:hypothetical protein
MRGARRSANKLNGDLQRRSTAKAVQSPSRAATRIHTFHSAHGAERRGGAEPLPPGTLRAERPQQCARRGVPAVVCALWLLRATSRAIPVRRRDRRGTPGSFLPSPCSSARLRRSARNPARPEVLELSRPLKPGTGLEARSWCVTIRDTLPSASYLLTPDHQVAGSFSAPTPPKKEPFED